MMAEKIEEELAEAAVRSRRTLYFDAAISCGLAAQIALLSFIYRHTTAGEFDPFLVYHVAVVGGGTFTAALGALKVVRRWRAMAPVKKGIATVALGYLGVSSSFFPACRAGLQWYTHNYQKWETEGLWS